MAGQHFLDPRPFYDVTVDQKYAFLDDMFISAKKDIKFVESALKAKPAGGGDKKPDGQDEGQKVEEKSKIQTIELDVDLCCDSCVWKVKEALDDVEGVEKVDCDQYNKKVLVKGSVKPEVVLKKVRKVKKHAELVQKKKQN